MELDQQRSETETRLNQVTKTPTKNKNSNRVAAGKKLAESLKKKAVNVRSNDTPTERQVEMSALYKGLGVVAVCAFAYCIYVSLRNTHTSPSIPT